MYLIFTNSEFTLNSHFSFINFAAAIGHNCKLLIDNLLKIVNCKLIIALERSF
jgi:hypothetical protein